MRILLNWLFIFCVFISNAQNDLRLISGDGSPFQVFVSDTAANKTAEASVLLQNLKQDTLLLKVKFENEAIQAITIFLLEKGKKTFGQEFDFRLIKKEKNMEVVFSGMYPVTALPQYIVPKAPVIDTTLKLKNTILGHLCELKNGRPFFYNNIPSEKKCTSEMPADYLTYLKWLMAKAYLPEEKYNLAENVVNNNCFNVAQLQNILTYIDYELDKLKMLRTAYFNLVDTVNRQQLKKSFRFESSFSELDSFFAHTGDYRKKATSDCSVPASQEAVGILNKDLAIFTNDHQRLESLKKNYSVLCFSLDQVKSVLRTFVHDREKLDAAKILYLNCTEKKDFVSVSSEFSYTHTSGELKDFVDRQNR